MPVSFDTPLLSSAVLGALSARDLALLKPDLVPCLFHTGSTLYAQGEEVSEVYFPKSGILALVLSSETRIDVEVAMIGREGVLGLSEALSEHPLLTRAEVHSDGSGWRISALALRQASAYSSTLSKVLWRAEHLLQRHIMQGVLCNQLHSVEQRLSRFLLMCQDRMQSPSLELTHHILSQMLGTRRVGVTLASKVLREAELIQSSRGQIEILDRPGLEAHACECYRAISAQSRALGGGRGFGF